MSITAIPEDKLELELAFTRAEQEKSQLLDILNAVLVSQGGRLVVPLVEIQAATRQRIAVRHEADYMVIELERPKAPKGSRRDLADRARAVGLELP